MSYNPGYPQNLPGGAGVRPPYGAGQPGSLPPGSVPPGMPGGFGPRPPPPGGLGPQQQPPAGAPNGMPYPVPPGGFAPPGGGMRPPGPMMVPPPGVPGGPPRPVGAPFPGGAQQVAPAPGGPQQGVPFPGAPQVVPFQGGPPGGAFPGGPPGSMGVPPGSMMGGPPPRPAGMPQYPPPGGGPPGGGPMMGGVPMMRPPMTMGGPMPPPGALGPSGGPTPGGMQLGPPPPGWRPGGPTGMPPGPPGPGFAAPPLPGGPGVLHPGVPPPPQPGLTHMGGNVATGYDPYSGQRLADQFEALTLGPGVGAGQQDSLDPSQLPRPIGQQRERALAAQPLFDKASCSASNMRLTVNGIPNGTALKARWPLPIGAIVHPMADEAEGRHVPVVNLGNAGIVRCRRCRTYMNPFVQWTDAGRRFKCNVCALLNDIPIEFFSPLDENGRRRDVDERPETAVGTVEYVAPAEYMVRPPMPPVYIFVLDVSHAAVSSGSLAVATAAIRDCLEQLPGDVRTLVGIITFDSTLHFYNLRASLTAPQMVVVTELDEPFVPLPDDLLVNLRDSMHVVTALLDMLPSMFAATTIVDCATGPALSAAFLMCSHVGCKLLLFQSGVPSLGAGKIKNRENPAHYNTEREPALRCPEDAFYKRFASECNRVQMTIDIFVCGSSQSLDLASLAALPRFTCGELNYYPGFNAQRDGPKLRHEVTHNLTRPTAWEAVMRVRCSKGLRISSFHGHFFNRSTDLLALPTCDPDKAFAVQIAHEENVVTGGVAFVQCALLYTNSNGERRIRVHTLSVPVVSELSDLYKGADAGALAAIMAKLAVEKSLNTRLDETRNAVQAKLVSALKEFRIINAAAVRQPNKFVFPETFKYLPLWTLATIKSTALRGGAKDVSPDERMAVGHELMAAPVGALLRLVYPDLYMLHDPNGPWGLEQSDGTAPLPQTCALSMGLLSDSGAYLLDNGRIFILWLGRLIAPQWCLEVFGAEPNMLPLDGPGLAVEPQRETAMSQRVNRVLRTLRHGRAAYQQCFVVRQGSPMETYIAQYFVEDRSQAAPAYADFMLSVHRAVMSSK